MVPSLCQRLLRIVPAIFARVDVAIGKTALQIASHIPGQPLQFAEGIAQAEIAAREFRSQVKTENGIAAFPKISLALLSQAPSLLATLFL